MSTSSHLIHALRHHRRHPAFLAVSVVILALGIALNSSVFSAVSTVMLRPLPFEASDRLVFVSETTATGGERPVSYPKLLDWARRAEGFDHLAGFSNPTYTVSGLETAERVEGELVSAAYFEMLGVEAATGRTFLSEEDVASNERRVAVVADSLWRRHGADPGMVGGPLVVNSVRFEVIGVLPEGFRGIAGEAELWLPIAQQAVAIPDLARLDSIHRRDVRWLAVLGRLRPDVTAGQASARLSALNRELLPLESPPLPETEVLVTPLRDRFFGTLEVPLLLLQAAVVLVLLIACSNLAHLMLVQVADRERELSVRLALGAARSTVTAQLLTEALVLSAAACAAGLLLTAGTVHVLSIALAETLPGYLELRIDTGVVAVAVLLSAISALVVALAPAVYGSRRELRAGLGDGAPTASTAPGHRRLRSLLTGVEVAASAFLLLNASLLTASFRRLQDAGPGFPVEDRSVFRLDLPPGRYDDARIVDFAARLTEALGNGPTARGVGIASDLPLGERETIARLLPEEPTSRTHEEGVRVYQHSVSPDFFATLGIPVQQGQGFAAGDTDEAPPVALLSRGAADRLWPGRSPVGKRFRVGGQPGREWITVVGTVEDIRYRTLFQESNPVPDVYFPFAQAPTPSFAVVVHTVHGAGAALPDLRSAVARLDPEVPVYAASTMSRHVARATFHLRFASVFMTTFGYLALVLATFGLYSVVAYATRRRQREMGIRMAFGADTWQVIGLVVRDGMRTAIGGLLAGALAAALSARALAGLLPGVGATEPVRFVGVLALLAVTALGATYLPARRLSRADPTEALASH